MIITEFSWVLFLPFLFLFMLSYLPVRQLIKMGSENALATYYMSITVRFMLVMIFLVLGADVELLYGIAIGLCSEVYAMLQLSREDEVSSCEVFA